MKRREDRNHCEHYNSFGRKQGRRRMAVRRRQQAAAMVSRAVRRGWRPSRPSPITSQSPSLSISSTRRHQEALRLQRLQQVGDEEPAAEAGLQVALQDDRSRREARPGDRRRRRLGDEGLGDREGRHALRPRLLPAHRPHRRKARQLPRRPMATAARWPSSPASS